MGGAAWEYTYDGRWHLRHNLLAGVVYMFS